MPHYSTPRPSQFERSNLGEEEIPLEIAVRAAHSEIRLVLGDGYGTNFVGSDQGLLTKLGLRTDVRSIVVKAAPSTKNEKRASFYD